MSQTVFSGKPIASLQTMLRTVAHTDRTIPTVLADGVYGENTKRAVSEIQRQSGRNVTGVTDFDTWQLIRERYDQARIEAEPAAALYVDIDPQQVFLPGCKDKHVFLIQAMLAALADDYHELSDVRVTGIYDEATEKAIRWLQKACDVQCSGICNKYVWKMLTGLYHLKIGNGKKT